ncbi:MAG TPA: sulfate permease, partial [Spongiibacteraceae bacterium]|nr:sulfate permease [Spongiibacteraceae bacterium]
MTKFFSAPTFNRYLPLWLRQYRREFFWQDLLAGAIVALMLVPQSMAYALVAGLPPQYGMYASILPLFAYAWFGTSMTLAVGPVAVTSLMTAAALTPLAAPGSAEYIAGAALLALLSGALLFVFGLLRFGFLAKLLSNPVISGFTSGSSLLILIGQIAPLLGLQVHADTAVGILVALLRNIATLHAATAAVGIGALLSLMVAREYSASLLRKLGCSAGTASLLPKLAPLLIVIGALIVASELQLAQRYGVAVVGVLPPGLPRLDFPLVERAHFHALLFPAFTIGLINFVSSISVAQALAIKRKQRIDADAELRALGAANIASALSGGFPVNGGFARSLVNFTAGAQTPLASIISALLMAALVVSWASTFAALPVAVLAATIIVAVAPVIDIGALRRAWRFDRADAIALAATACGVVLLGVEAGIAIGIGVSLISLVWRSSQPHIAVLGRVPFTEHFRNVLRYKAETLPQVLALRIDENLLFANAQAVEQRVRVELDRQPAVEHVLLVLSSVSQIDATALDMLTELNSDLATRGVALHFAEIKGP